MTDAYRQFVRVGDCLQVMPTLEADSFDSIVTDPPYGLGFMGKGWDHAVPGVEFWREALRVAKPGAWLAAFGGTRTYHRLACAIEDAGWELRDSVLRMHEGGAYVQVEDCPWLLAWAYGSGFPKSHNGEWGGTALKPAWEPIILARKPLAGTVEANWREHGTGALNIDGCRVGTNDNTSRACNEAGYGLMHGDSPRGTQGSTHGGHAAGRWPANVIHDGSDEVLACFPDAPGQQGDLTGNEPSRPAKNTYGEYAGRREFKARGKRPGGFGDVGADKGDPTPCGPLYADRSGSAARFFYCAKADRADRNDGLEGMQVFRAGERAGGRTEGSAGLATAYAGTRTPGQNNHPTVKPTDLMRWLCRLVTPTGGLILDPFAGSGSTGRGAIAEGFRFVGIELSPEYAAIAEARIRAVQPGLALGSAA